LLACLHLPALLAPAHRPHDPQYMCDVELDPELLLQNDLDARSAPQIVWKSERSRAVSKSAFQHFARRVIET